ncbi:putative transposase element L1Md-A101/L1Md-A102/L1Md-A2 [Labeo rohita]|uniref:Putative transposase element L1Md-A101/L1Md-A102/L1Md-A2 n=1 Tax=Labeo rohita TaxID=84645 RepID=A0A498NU24_LABRO|nr:putative transposase element L1Md-A101/L1Md-A102/L1Md-A2 [Labeo rohita]
MQALVDTLHDTVNSFQSRLTSTEVIVGENFERLVAAESTINSLKAQNSLLMERLDDLENRSCRSNLRILNVPEGSESGNDPTVFDSEMLAEVMPEVFTSPPPLERAHRSLGPKPAAGNPASAFVMLRVYPDLSNVLAKKRAAFNPAKQALYKEGIWFRLLYPARLKVTFKEDSFIFETPDDANDFYEKQVLVQKEK